MLIPIRHENMSARRWPVITLALIVINTLAFLATDSRIENQAKALGQTRKQIVLFAAAHPDVKVPGEAGEFVREFRRQYPATWTQLTAQPHADVPAETPLLESVNPAQIKMNQLADDYAQAADNSILERYAFVPAHPRPLAYLTANFLHGGWLHLIGNMWFLWLAGFVLEDAWGRVLYSIVYLIAGAVALQIQAVASPGSMIPTIGASGAVAALMGAFLVRFPRMKIRMMWLFSFRAYRFNAPAYALLPLWLAMEVLFGTVFGSSSGVAHWAHVGGFAFGMVAAVALRYSGLEHKANKEIEEQVSWQADPEIAHATELLEHRNYDEAVAMLNAYVAAHPDSVDGLNLLQQACAQKGDLPAQLGAMARLCSAYLRQRQPEAAWDTYQDFLRSGGKQLPPATWLELCRVAEGGPDLERARAEYEGLAAAYPDQRQSVMAQIGMGRISLKLQRAQDALSAFQAASASRVPHLDLDDNIEAGMREAKAMLTAPGAAAAQHA